MKAMKIILGVVAALVTLVVIGLVVLVAVFDPNDYKDFAAGKVREVTGRTLTFEGDLELKVFPWIAIRTGGVSFGNAPGFGEEPMVKVAGASVGLKLLPLLSGSVEVGDVAVDGLKLNLMKNAEGVTNWDDLTKGSGEAAEASAQEQAASADAGSSLNVSVGGVKITNADVVWDDRQSAKRFAVSGAEVTLGALQLPKPFDFSVRLTVASADPQAEARITAKGRLAYDMETRKLGLTGPSVTVEASGEAVPGKRAEVDLSAASLDADLAQQVLSVRELALSAYGVNVTGTVTGKSFLDNPTLAGDMAVAPFNLKDTLGLLGIAAPDTADPQALSNVSAELKFSYLPDAFDAPETTIRLDDTTARVAAKVSGFASPSYYLRARVDKLDADRYLPPTTDEAAAETTTESGDATQETAPAADGPSEAEKSVLALLKTLKVDAALVMDALKIKGMDMTDVQVRVLARDGVLEVTPASLKMYRGAISTNTRLDGTGQRLATGLDLTVDGVEAGDAIRGWVGDKGFEGTVNLNTTRTITFRGLDEPTATRSLNGAFAFRILDGVFPGVDLKGLLGDADKLKQQRTGTLEGSPEDRTEFGELTGSAVISEGVLANQDLCLKAPHIRASGEGVADLGGKTVDYLVTAMLIPNAQGQGGVSCADAYGIGMPVRVSGSLMAPSFGVDAAEFLAMVARGPLKLAGAGFDALGSALGTAVDAPAQILDSVTSGIGSVIGGVTGESSGKSSGGAEDSEDTPKATPGKQVEDAIKGFGKLLGN
jgi:AsmA protein